MSVIFAHTAQATQISLGLNYGFRHVENGTIQDTYGNGTVYVPYLRLTPFKSVGIEIAYEGGYERSGTVGIFEEKSTLSVTGWEFSGILYLPISPLIGYIKFGMAYYTYEQDIESEFIRDPVDDKTWTNVFGIGASLMLTKGLYVSVEVKTIPLRVRPFDREVDLSGVRVVGGIGYSFNF
ncbi:MAG: hypothetical protein PVH84_18055 [Candidatus Aminicenantes bacterium]|jgi:hypothetical protein